MSVSENSGTPKSSKKYRVFHYKPSILGYPYFGNTHIDVKGNHPSLWYTSECWTLLSVLQVFAAGFM